MIDRLREYREVYVEHLHRVIAKRCGGAEKAASELWLELPETSAMYKRYFRVDAITNEGKSKSFEANIDLPKGEAELVEVDGLPIVLEPIVWNGVDLDCRGCTTISLQVLNNWFEQWFDEKEVRKQDENGTSGVIHSLRVEGSVVSVDFGSAPPEALVDLVSILTNLSPDRILIHSSHQKV